MTSRPDLNPPAPSGAGNDQPAFRLGGLLAPLLESGLDEDNRQIVKRILDRHLQGIAAVQDALETEDLERCADVSHSLVGAVGGIGAMALAEGLARLELVCRDGDLERAAAAWAVVKQEQEKVLPVLQEFLSAE